MATCNDCRQRMTCIMAAPDGRWSACDKFEERAKMIIPIKLEKRTEGERETYAEGYAAGKRDAENYAHFKGTQYCKLKGVGMVD